MTVAAGVSLGPYEILAHIGSGGMGEVWKARDSRIGREVAIKVLPEIRTGDDRVRRFEQEARAAGALNHPGLVTIFDVGTTGSSPYIVMELLEGDTLRAAIGDLTGSPLPLRKALDYGIQIASALAVAHEKGIIHRDLKPENIFVTSDNRVKILDFGLAKLTEEPADQKLTQPKRQLTSAGIVVGTPAYMSPEQARAQQVDHRTDIFALGSVLYEMLTGTAVFERSSAVETMHAILTVDPPPLTAIDPKIPPALDAIVRHCLEKNPRERCQSARDLAFQLRMLAETQPTVSEVGAVSSSTARALAVARRRLPVRAAAIGLAAVLAAAAAGFTLSRIGGGKAEPGTRAFKQLTFGDGLETFPALSPDGKSIAYSAATAGNQDIYVQRVDGRVAVNLTADSLDDDSQPAFSPDGSQIAFRSERDGGGIFVMGVTGESVRRLTDFGYNPAWSPDGFRIAISTVGVDLKPHVHPADGNLWIVDTRTGAKRLVLEARGGTAEFSTDALQPNWSPSGKRIAFWGVSTRSHGQRDLWTIEPDAPKPIETLVRASSDPSIHWNPVWSPDGKWLYFGSNRDGTLNLWRIAIDQETGKTSGAAEALSLPASLSGHFAVSQTGEIAFTTVTRSYRVLALPFDTRSLTLGEPQPLFGGTQEIMSFEASPDGQTIAFTSGGAQEDVFVVNADGSRLRQLTGDEARDRSVTWSPDGKTLYFYSNRGGPYHVWSIRADGSGLAPVTTKADFDRTGVRNIYLPRVAPDGKALAAEGEPPASMIVYLDRPAGRRLELLDARLAGPRWSPDGRQVTGVFMNEAKKASGIALFTPQTGQAERLVERGRSPEWLPDSARIVFFEKDTVAAIDTRTRRIETRTVKPPQGVDLSSSRIAPRLSRDGSRLYVHQTLEQGDLWLLRLGGG